MRNVAKNQLIRAASGWSLLCCALLLGTAGCDDTTGSNSEVEADGAVTGDLADVVQDQSFEEMATDDPAQEVADGPSVDVADTADTTSEPGCELRDWYPDVDGDGFGDDAAVQQACEQPEDHIDVGGDCHDDVELAYPGSHWRETPGDGVDQDCDGLDACRDLSCDGRPDIVFAQTDLDGEHLTDSWVYLGSDDGYSPDHRIAVRTLGAMGVDTADFDKDGYIDLVFAAVQDGESRLVNSRVIYGTAEGFDDDNPVELPTIGCADPTAADVDKDGWVDIIFSNRYRGGGGGFPSPGDYYNDSYIYWGSAEGFSVDRRTGIPTIGAARSRVADLNEDGFNDIVFANGVLSLISSRSYIYWGSETGFSEDRRAELPSEFPEGLTVYDINDDSHLDILVTSWMCTFCEGNFIYWGSESARYGEANRAVIEGAVGATDAQIAHVDDDGFIDLVIANGAFGSQVSWIYYGSDAGWVEDNRLELPATAASEAGVGDLDEDGYLDVVFASHYAPSEGQPEVSQIYWGSESGISSDNATELPTVHAAGMKIVGLR